MDTGGAYLGERVHLTTQGISMRQFMELQAVFALVILSGEVPSGLLSDLWARKNFSLLPLSYASFLFYHLTMGIALSMISGGDVALLGDSYLAALPGYFLGGIPASSPVVHPRSFFGPSAGSGVTYTRMGLRWARAQ